MYQHIETTTPIASKGHQCIWCNELIPGGERYVNNKCNFDGDFQRQKFHVECHRACCDSYSNGAIMSDEGFERGAQKRGVAIEPYL